MTEEIIANKRAAAKAAVQLVADKMTVGLGSGSTAIFFIEQLAERCRREKLGVKVLPTSLESHRLAEKEGLVMIPHEKVTRLDLTVDGADEVDGEKRLIKGGGGALLREKIVASMSDELIIVVDESKCVKKLGLFPLPVEIVPFAFSATLFHLSQLGFAVDLRKKRDGSLFVSDNNNLLVDVTFGQPVCDPEKIDRQIRAVPGVIETGFFFNLADRIVVGLQNGTVKIVT